MGQVAREDIQEETSFSGGRELGGGGSDGRIKPKRRREKGKENR